MKKGLSLLGLIFALGTLVGHAQIYQVYSQDFETGTPQTYSVTGSNSVQTALRAGGSSALKMSNNTASSVILQLDTLDFSSNAQYNYYTLEFMHIAFILPEEQETNDGCIIEAKRPDQTRWLQLTDMHYNTSDGGSPDFAGVSSFYRYLYEPDWTAASAPNNTMWKNERFDLDQFFMGVPPQNRKLLIRFVLPKRLASAGSPGQSGWYIDDIRLRASSQQIVSPIINMLSFPDNLSYPSSRGAKVAANVTTTALQGIDPDSVFLEYTVGSDHTVQRAYMHRVGTSSRYEGRIPFYGYDTLMSFHLVAKDMTTNRNTAYYPKNETGRLVYKCVRGKTNSGSPVMTNLQQATLPFPTFADNRSEFIYDSVLLDSMGFKPGAITKFRLIQRSTYTRTQTRQRFQIKMANVPNSTSRPNTTQGERFITQSMQVVYDSAFSIDQAAIGSYKTIDLQDTFFYAGGDIVVQVMYHNPTNLQAATQVLSIPTPANKASVYMACCNDNMGLNPFVNLDGYNQPYTYNRRPWVQFYSYKNLPLVYDCGISAMAYPTFDIPANVGVDSVAVWLKNFGVSPMNAVRIAYSVDNGAPVYYDWTGTLNGGDSVRVLLSTTQTFTLGYHTVRSWVEDTITVGTNRFRDHEPFNDTVFTPFATCAGPYSGTLTVGPNASYDFVSLEKCLFSLSRCGISAPVTIKLPAGTYGYTEFPFIPGTSRTNYVLFEPATATAQVTFRRSTTLGRGQTLVDMSEARSIRFRNIKFANARTVPGSNEVLVRMGQNSSNCQFLNCTFIDSAEVQGAITDALLSTGYADSVLVEGCTFYGGTVGIDVIGAAPDHRATGNVIRFNELAYQLNTGISVVNQNHVLVDSNTLNNVRTNASYVILCQYVYDNSRITRNRVFSTKGASCIGVSDMHGTATNFCYVANNMLLSLDDGTTNQLTTPLNMIKGSYVKVVFNSVRLRTHTHVNVAAATLGGGVINNCYFQNNVVAAFDTLSHAFAFIPTSTSSDNIVNHNCYWSTSGILNKYSGVNYSNLNSWTRTVTMDVGSVMCDPGFTNSSISIVDLRSFNPQLRNVGVPIPGITDDIEGTTRNAAAPSLGAYEVAPLAIDFKPEEMIAPFSEYCGAPASIPIEVAIRNVGIQPYTYSSAHPLTVHVSVEGRSGVQSFTVNRPVPADDTIHFRSNVTLSLPANTDNTDATYHITWWVNCNLDPDNLNDTAQHTVESRYAPPAPTAINQNVAYNNTLTITPTAGVNTWPVNYYTTGQGRVQRSGIYWYNNIDDTVPFHYGPSYTTPPIFANDTFYIAQKRNLPLVKITEVQVSNAATAVGRTTPLPSWMNAQTAFAVELTNCGDYPADLEGDSIVVILSTAAAKIWVLPRVTIQPGACLVLQFKANTAASDSSRTIYTPTSTLVPTVTYNTNFAIIYRDGHGIADAVPFNNVISASSSQTIKWSNQNVRAAVWQGAAVQLGTSPVAGAYRKAWPTNASNASPTPTATLWQVASATTPMHIGTPKPHLVLYNDNGCEGSRAPVRINVTGVPTTDVSVDVPVVDTGCNLTTSEQVHVTIHNYGSQPANSVTVKYSIGGSNTAVCTNTISSIPGRGSVNHTFTVPINMHQNRDSLFQVKVWVNSLSTDASHTNDTNTGYFLSRYTPVTPAVASPQTVNYAQTVNLTINPALQNARAVWYNAQMLSLDTTDGSFTTPRIYYNDTFYVSAIATTDVDGAHVGTLASASALTGYPSPYNPKTRFVKEQYLITAEQMQNAGHGAGSISSISFYLENIGGSVESFTFSRYVIRIGTTTLSTFSGSGSTGTFVTGLTEVYNSSNFTLTRSDLGWVKHHFNTPFVWNGTSNIVIEVIHEIGTAISTGASTRYTTQANTVITKQGTSSVDSQTSGSKGGNRPDMRFGFLEAAGCQSPSQQILVNVINLPSVDGNLHWDPALDTMTIASCAATPFSVRIENSGSNPINAYTLRYRIDGGSWQTVNGNANNLTTGHSRIAPLVSTHLTPGRHRIQAYITVSGDNVHANDTIDRLFNIRFCTGVYTIGATPGNDYATLQTAIDTLHNAGVAGAITFRIDGGTYNGQFNFGVIDGTSFTKTVRFAPSLTATQPVKIMFAPTQANNYVMRLNGSANVIFDSLYFYGTFTNNGLTTGTGAAYSNVLRIENCENVSFLHSTIRTRARNTFANTSNLVVLGNNNSYVTFDHCLLDSGYYQVTTFGGGVSSGHHLIVTNSDLLNFHYRAIDIRNIDTVQIQSDSITSAMTAANKPLIGITVSNANHASIKKNFILLMDNASGGKRGIQLFGCKGTNVDRVTVYNNMISLKGTGAGGSVVPAGIVIDSNSTYVSVYYNSIRLKANDLAATATVAAAHKAFSVERSSRVFVLNNIFMNASKGYAYYVATDTCVNLSNYNVYWTTADSADNRKFAFWGENCPYFDSLRVKANSGQGNGNEINSMEDKPIFEGERDLRMHLAAYSGLAQYNSDVTDDIFDSIRPQIPTPTIGCHEFLRLMHNVAIAEIIEPIMPEITVGNNAQVYNIETDSIMVRVKFYNNGMAPENNVHWYAELIRTNPLVRSANRPIRLPLRTMVEDSVKLFSPLGAVDTQYVVVYLVLEGSVDNDTMDNIDTAAIFIYPAYDLQVVQIAYTNNTPAGCRMFQVPITYTLKNVGKKDFPSDTNFNLGYYAYCSSPQNLTLPNLPTMNSETVSFGTGNDLPVGTTREVTLTPPFQPNLAPMGQLQDITVKIRGWVDYQHDVKPLNDTSNYINISTYHTPEPPIGHDTVVDYGTYATLYATQNATRPISWGKDSSGVYFYQRANNTNQYSQSTHWEARQTWQYALPYFHDTTFYLCCFSSHQCTSYYSPITVSINPPLQYDVAISEVLSPRGVRGVPIDEYLEGRVYHEVDTVRLRVVNYGSQPITNIPIGFKFMSNNLATTYLEGYDTIRVTIPGRVGDNVSHYDFQFPDSLMLQIPGNRISAATYSLNAWVNHPDDQQHNNDTLSTIHKFKTYPETTYDSIKVATPSSDAGFDITRVSYNTLDNEMPEMFGYHYRNFGSYNPATADVPTLYVRRGTVDTLFIEVANNLNELDSSTGASLYVAIDYNRNGHYADGREGWKEVLTGQRNLTGLADYCTKVRSRRVHKIPLTIPEYAHFGYMRMLVLVDADTGAHPHRYPGIHDSLTNHTYSFENGQAQEYLLFVQEPGTELENDAAMSRVSFPHQHVLQGMTHDIGVMLANKGRTPMTSATITAEFYNPEHRTTFRTINWTGNLEPGMSELVTFDSVTFFHGTTNMVCSVTMYADSLNSSNDTLRYQYHIFDTITLYYNDDFDLTALSRWYAAAGNSLYTRNLFERGTPSKSHISSAYSAPNAYVTGTQRSISLGNRGNRSVLYSPVFYVAVIRPDTLSFMLNKNLLNGSSLRLEYNNYNHEWINLDDPEAGRDSAHVSWYDEDTLVWRGSSPANSYESKRISINGLGTELRSYFQLRFVYEAPYSSSSSSTYGDGAAIDNFFVGRARRPQDCGVIAITQPTDPRFGETIYPTVLIKNYGTAMASDVAVAYHPYGAHLPIEDVCPGPIPSDSVYEFTFSTPFIVRNTFPDTFSICAFTMQDQDIYLDNDTTCAEFGLSPLDNDMYMYELLSPLSRAVAGDSIVVRVRLRNFGQSPVDDVDVSYSFNNGVPVTEHVDFNQILGHPLGSTEFFDYVFTRRIRATMGTMEISTWVDYSLDSYRYNDTIQRQIVGINSVTDVYARSITPYESFNDCYFILIIENQGARMVNNFKVGLWWDNDTTTKFEENFYREGGLPGGGHASHIFSRTDEHRSAARNYITAYVVVPGDQDRTNDTTTNVVQSSDLLYDIQTNAVEVEENETDYCRVRIELENIGDMPYVTATSFRIEATVNGHTLRDNVTERVDPGCVRHFLFHDSIPKDPNRHYTGTGSTNITDDDRVNNTTSMVRVLNYFEGTPVVRNEEFTLSQNYPNPFDGSTRIEFNLPESGIVRFNVTDALGRLVYSFRDYYNGGLNTVSFQRDALPAGIYYYSVEFQGQRRMKKMIIR